jgi:hypothetical protein
MSRVRRHGPETSYLTEDRRLTARPAVLAKRTEARIVKLPVPAVDDPGPHANVDLGLVFTSAPISCAGFWCGEYNPQAISAVLALARRGEGAVSTRFRPFAFAR